MEVPLLDLQAQYNSIRAEIDEAVRRVLESQYFIMSREVSNLEEEVAVYCGTTGACGVASGTDAIILALRAAGVGKGDKVITTPFTFFATAESISILGAEPVFADIAPDTYNIDPDKVEELIKASDPYARGSLKAIIPVHLYGQCADMDRITDIARKYGLKIVEDCAQAIGASYKGRMAGSMGDAGCLSFFPSKNLGAFGDGGMIVSSDPSLIDEVKRLRVHGSREQYIHEDIGYNSRLDSLQAAILRVKLSKLNGWLEARRQVAARYNEAFSGMGIKVPAVAEGNVHTYHQYTIEVEERNGLKGYLNDNGIAARVYYPVPLHLQPCYRHLGVSIGEYPVSEKAAEKVLSLPVYPELGREREEYIIKTVQDFMKRR